MGRSLRWLLLVAVTAALATEPVVAADDGMAAITRHAGDLQERAASDPDLETIRDAAGRWRQGGLADFNLEAFARTPFENALPMAAKPGELLLFVSASLGDVGLRDALLAASGEPSVTLVFRGVLPDETLADAVRRLGVLLRDLDPEPNVMIHPKLFRDHGVSVVPTVVGSATSKTLRGTLSIETFRQRAARTSYADLGVAGPVAEIAEPDLAERIRQRIAKVDLRSRARATVANHWQRIGFVNLPKAQTSSQRRLDPTVITTSDLRAANGNPLVPAGSRVNPLASLPFSGRILVFDGTDPAERAWAKAQIAPDRATTLITTHVDRGKGWRAWRELHHELGQPVFLLRPTFAERLAIRATPTMIEAADDGLAFSIIEQVPSRRTIDAAGAR